MKQTSTRKTMLGRFTSTRARSGSNRISMRSTGSNPSSEGLPAHVKALTKDRRKNKKVLPASKTIVGTIHRYKGINEKWAFSASSQSSAGLKEAACELLLKGFKRLHLGEKTKKMKTLESTARPAISHFVDALENMYNESAFHSFVHAVDVAQLMFTLIEDFFLARIRREEYFYLIVAALCHDICHPGAGAATLKNYGLLDKDASLESYHIQKTVEILESNQFELFTNTKFLSQKQRKELVRYCRVLIDATDISRHKKYVEAAMKKHVGSKGNLAIEHLAILMKVSDLANISRDFKDSSKWSENFKIETEAEKEFVAEHEDKHFFGENMSQDEKMRNLSDILCSKQEIIRSMHIRENSLRIGTSNTTLSFMRAFAFPLVDCLSRMNTNAASVYGARIRHNQEHWNNLRL